MMRSKLISHVSGIGGRQVWRLSGLATLVWVLALASCGPAVETSGEPPAMTSGPQVAPVAIASPSPAAPTPVELASPPSPSVTPASQGDPSPSSPTPLATPANPGDPSPSPAATPISDVFIPVGDETPPPVGDASPPPVGPLTWACVGGDYPGLDPNFCAPLPACYLGGTCLMYETTWYLPSKLAGEHLLDAACADIAPAHHRSLAACRRDLPTWDSQGGWGVDPMNYGGG